MDKIILSTEQIQELVFKNRYPVEEKTKFLSRCIDGRYSNEKNLPPLAIPGADVGELALILATGNVYGFEVDAEKALKTLVDLVGGTKNFQFHTDHHGDKKLPGSGCGHFKQIRLDPLAFNLEKKQVKFLEKKLKELKKKGADEVILAGEHQEGAILQVKGDYSVYPRLSMATEEGMVEVEVFVYQTSLVNARHRVLAEKLVENKAVKLFVGCDGEYLYEALSEMAENHLFETAKRLAPGFPIYLVTFKNDGGFEIEEMGKVI